MAEMFVNWRLRKVDAVARRQRDLALLEREVAWGAPTTSLICSSDYIVMNNLI